MVWGHFWPSLAFTSHAWGASDSTQRERERNRRGERTKRYPSSHRIGSLFADLVGRPWFQVPFLRRLAAQPQSPGVDRPTLWRFQVSPLGALCSSIAPDSCFGWSTFYGSSFWSDLVWNLMMDTSGGWSLMAVLWLFCLDLGDDLFLFVNLEFILIYIFWSENELSVRHLGGSSNSAHSCCGNLFSSFVFAPLGNNVDPFYVTMSSFLLLFF